MSATYSFVPDAAPYGFVRGPNGRRCAVGVLTFGGTYTAPGGDVLPTATSPNIDSTAPPGTVRLEFLDAALSSGEVPTYDPTTRKIKLYKGNTANPMQEVANGAA